MLLRNLHIVGKENSATDIRLDGDKIAEIGEQKASVVIDFDKAIAFPGLINAHDHLEFNLFPQLGSRYDAYPEWGPDIHTRYRLEIKEVLDIPVDLRIKWGILKNIFNGVTTVAHHGTQQDLSSDFVNIFTRYNYLHSLALEKFWKWKLNHPFKRLPIMLHVGEGITRDMSDEIDELIRWNFIKKTLIGIHGIAMNEQQANHFKAVVWCPDSNLFLYGKTAQVDLLKRETNILFGTDATLSASANLWEHLRLARKLQMLDDQELFEALTTTAASVFDRGTVGEIAVGKTADLIIGRRKEGNLWDAFFGLNPEDIMMIIKGGKIIYFDEEIKEQEALNKSDFAPIAVGNRRKFILNEMHGWIKQLEVYKTELPLNVKSHG